MRISSLSTLALALPGPALAFHTRSTPARDSAENFDWDSITPSRNLEYHACYGKLKCARLKVPLDWSGSGNSSEWAAIAIATLPATVSEDDESFGGTVLINPGGPGGSGTLQAIEAGEIFQGIVDGEKHYEILGFDPRGMAWSTPRADCYNNTLNRVAYSLNVESVPALAVPGRGLEYYQAISQGQSDLCAGSDASSILGHMSTASVARDMLEIVEKVDNLRHGRSYPNGASEAKLQYFGVSYGTFLGNTFASMFPDRVGRMIIDGVVNPDAFVDGGYRDTINDAETVLFHFYETCFQAGESCLLRLKTDKSAQDIKNRVDTLLATLDETPAVHVAEGRGRLVTTFLLRETIRRALYSPIDLYESLSQLLAASAVGEWGPLLQSPLAQLFSVADAASTCSATVPAESYSWNQDTAMGVLCGDTLAQVGNHNTSWAEEMVDYLHQQAPSMYDGWAKLMLLCSGWSIQPKYVFAGPFGSRGKECKAPPILVLSNRYDHATPLANAIKVHESYEGSGLVIQESYGHTTVYTSPSKCTTKVIQHYMATGEVPDEVVICEPDCQPEIPAKACPGIPSA